MKTSAVVFDSDGVVIDSEGIIFEAAKIAFKKYGVTLKHEDVVGGIGAGDLYIRLPMEKYGITQVTLEQLYGERDAIYREMAPGRLRAKPGVKELLHDLKRRKFKTALASSATTETIYFNLKTVGIA